MVVLAYRKYSPWSSMVQPLILPADCPRATTCVVDLTSAGAKRAIIASYPPQPVEEHTYVCEALARLPTSLPHHLLVVARDL